MPDLNNLPSNTVMDLKLDDLRPYWLWPVHVKILFLTDGSISYRKNVDFGISDAAFIIREAVHSYVRFDLTLAHRSSDIKNDWANSTAGGRPGGAEFTYSPGQYNPYIKNFRFYNDDSHGAEMNINTYDQVWFFGIENGSSPVRLGDAELATITNWMNAGGSVFATGDHQDLGAGLAGRIPRVKSMRKWEIIPGDSTQSPDQIQTLADRLSSGHPDSYFESYAPGLDGWYRHDASRPNSPSQANGTTDMPFNNQSDNEPQTIDVERYYLGRNGIFDKYAPHPILCGGTHVGILDVLPDHPHEGEIVVPPDSVLNSSEYPNIGGVHPTPRVIAHANVLGQPPYRYFKHDVKRVRYGVIGAYDGEDVNVGRIVVDATWHHWMDINIAALDPANITPYTQNLKNGNPEAYQKISTYYRNIAIWLSSKADRNAMLHRVLSTIIDLNPEEFNVFVPIYRLGLKAKDVLGRSVTDCTTSDIIIKFIEPLLVEKIFHIPKPECLSCPDRDFLDAHILGGILNQMLILKEETAQNPEKIREVSEKEIAQVVSKGIYNGYEQMVSSYKRSVEEGQEMLRLMEKALSTKSLEPQNFIARKEIKPENAKR